MQIIRIHFRIIILTMIIWRSYQTKTNSILRQLCVLVSCVLINTQVSAWNIIFKLNIAQIVMHLDLQLVFFLWNLTHSLSEFKTTALSTYILKWINKVYMVGQILFQLTSLGIAGLSLISWSGWLQENNNNNNNNIIQQQQ